MLDEKKSDDLLNNGDFLRTAENIFHDIGKHLDRVGLNVSLEELQGRYDDALKKIIRDEEHGRNCRYIGGEFKISALDEKNYQCSYALYFEDTDKSFHALETKSKPLDVNCLTEDFRRELQRDKILSFGIDEP